MQRRVEKFRRTAKRAKKMIRLMGKAMIFTAKVGLKALKMGFVGASAAIVATGLAVKGVLAQFSKIEDAEAQFTPLLGSTAKAKELVEALNQTAASTPFQFETLSGVATQLLPSMNGSIEDTIRLTRMLGDTAGGNAQKFETITRGFNKALIKGKVDLESLNMIAEAGVPIFQELGKQTGKTGKQLFKSISAGKISVEDLTKTFETMTSEGGIFFKGMEIASKTLTGKISTLKDNISLTAAELGSALAPVVKDLVDESITFVQEIKELVKQNKALIKTKIREWAVKFKQAIVDLWKWLKAAWPQIKKTAFQIKELAQRILSLIATIWEFRNALIPIIAGFIAIKGAMAAIELVKFASDLTQIAGAATEAIPVLGELGSALGKGGLVAAAAAAGVAVGLFINQLIQDSQKLGNEINNRALAAQQGLGEASLQDLQKRNQELSRGFEKASGFGAFLSDVFAPGAANAEAMQTTLESQRRIIAELESRKQRGMALQQNAELMGLGGERGGGGTFPGQVVAPATSTTSRSETVTTERTELTIRDESGRAEITKGGANGTVKLVPTGGMP
jgi:tape measure domain-containing protein